FRRMDALLEDIELQPMRTHDDDFAIEHEGARQHCWQLFFEFREVAPEGLQVPALQINRRAIEEDDATKAIPLRFEVPARAFGDSLGKLREHRCDGWLEGECERFGHRAEIVSARVLRDKCRYSGIERLPVTLLAAATMDYTEALPRCQQMLRTGRNPNNEATLGQDPRGRWRSRHRYCGRHHVRRQRFRDDTNSGRTGRATDHTYHTHNHRPRQR